MRNILHQHVINSEDVPVSFSAKRKSDKGKIKSMTAASPFGSLKQF